MIRQYMQHIVTNLQQHLLIITEPQNRQEQSQLRHGEIIHVEELAINMEVLQFQHKVPIQDGALLDGPLLQEHQQVLKRHLVQALA